MVAQTLLKNSPIKALIKTLLLTIGVAYLLKIIFEIGILELWQQVQKMEWGFFLIMIIALSEFLSHAWAWTFTFPEGVRPLGFWSLTRVWLSANAIKSLNPLGNVGGETYRWLVLTRFINKKDATASMVLDNFSHILMMLTLLACAFMFSLLTLPWEGPFLLMVGFFFFCLLGIFFWILKLKKGGVLFQLLTKAFCRIFPLNRDYWMGYAKILDDIIKQFFARNKTFFLQLNFFHFMGKFVGFLEVWVIFIYLKEPIGLADSFLIYSFLQLITVLFFFIPSQIGVAEGGTYHLFEWMGLTPEIGVAMALIRRVRTLAWVFLGYGLVAFGSNSKKAEKPESLNLQP